MALTRGETIVGLTRSGAARSWAVSSAASARLVPVRLLRHIVPFAYPTPPLVQALLELRIRLEEIHERTSLRSDLLLVEMPYYQHRWRAPPTTFVPCASVQLSRGSAGVMLAVPTVLAHRRRKARPVIHELVVTIAGSPFVLAAVRFVRLNLYDKYL